MASSLEFSGKKLDDLIKQRGWTVPRFAQLLAMASPQYKATTVSIYRWIRGDRTPEMNYLPALKLVLGLKDPVAELFEERQVN